jgi:hypothetical protein
MKTKQYPTQGELKNLFLYNEETGLLYYKTLPHKCYRYKTLDKPCGSINKSTGYRLINYNGGKYAAHRLIWIMHYGNIPVNKVVDHINNIKDDNRIENLQLLSIYENTLKNKERTNPTKYVGVRKKRNRFQSYYFYNSKEIYLGSYSTEELAYQARLNFISSLQIN